MMRRRVSCLSVVICAAALGCGMGTGPDDPNVQISGTVTSARDGTQVIDINLIPDQTASR